MRLIVYVVLLGLTYLVAYNSGNNTGYKQGEYSCKGMSAWKETP